MFSQVLCIASIVDHAFNHKESLYLDCICHSQHRYFALFTISVLNFIHLRSY